MPQLKKIHAEISAKDLPNEIRRTLKRFALYELSGTLACEYKILPFKVSTIQRAVRAVVAIYLEQAKSVPDSIRGMLAVRDFCMKNQAKFKSTTPELDDEGDVIRRPVFEQHGYHDADFFYLFPAAFGPACADQTPQVVARQLRDRTLLLPDSDGVHIDRKKRVQD